MAVLRRRSRSADNTRSRPHKRLSADPADRDRSDVRCFFLQFLRPCIPVVGIRTTQSYSPLRLAGVPDVQGPTHAAPTDVASPPSIIAGITHGSSSSIPSRGPRAARSVLPHALWQEERTGSRGFRSIRITLGSKSDYCTVPAAWANTYRHRPVEEVVAELDTFHGAARCSSISVRSRMSPMPTVCIAP